MFGNGNGNGNSIPEFWERNETLLFPGMIGNGNGNGIEKLSEIFSVSHFLMRQQYHITDIVARIMIRE